MWKYLKRRQSSASQLLPTYGRFLALIIAAALITVGVPAWANLLNESHHDYAQATGLIRQAQQDYERGQFQQAVNALKTAINRFESTGEHLQKAVALGNLSLAYQGLRNWSEAQSAIEQSLGILGVTPDDLPLETTSNLEQTTVLASTLDIYGQLWQKQGNFAQAFEIWQQAAILHQITDNAPAWLGSQINQIRALEILGLYQQAKVKAAHVGCALGEDIEGIICSVSAFNPDALPAKLKAQGLRSLGDTLRQVGELELSRDVLERSQANVDTIQDRQALLLSLGNTYEALGTREKERDTSDNRQGIIPWRFVLADEGLDKAENSYKEAEKYFSRVLENNETSETCPGRLPEKLNQIQLTAGVMCLSVRLEQNNTAPATQRLWNSLYGRIVNDVIPNRTLVYTSIRLAKQGAYLNQMGDDEPIGWDQIVGLLQKAIDTAEQLQDKPAESYAVGNLGGLYEYFDWVDSQGEPQFQFDAEPGAKAAALSQRALLLAQPSTFPEIAYQWQWQLARLKQAKADRCSHCSQTEKQALTTDAINTYEQSINTLEQVRESLLSINADIQFSFRDNIEPIYRELVDLKLQADNPDQEELQAVVNLIDKLQISELESFLRCRLTTTKLEKQDIDPHAAVLYPIILRDRMEVILALPDGSLHRSQPSIDPQKLDKQDIPKYVNSAVRQFRESTGSLLGASRTPKFSTDFYELLIRPFDLALEANTSQMESNIKTLVFVLDGELRNLPMSALLDVKHNTEHGGRFLIERYAVAVAPSLQLIAPDPLSKPINVLVAGSSEAIQHPFKEASEFSALPFVEREVNAIHKLVEKSEKLLDTALTRQNFIQKLTENQFSIVHLATHGEFSSDPNRTFVMLADGAFYAADFNNLFKETIPQSRRIDLLVLSACQTAVGDKRAVLGMAGLAVQAGASSTLSTLWDVDDVSASALMIGFYKELQADDHRTKAEALQQAQLKLMMETGLGNPYHWAPYTLVGNWR